MLRSAHGTARRRAWSAVTAAVTVTAALAACGVAEGPAPRTPAGDRAPSVRHQPLILHADAYGAVVFDPDTAAYSGVRRDGQTVWRNANARAESRDPVCLERCPDVVFSADQDRPGQESTAGSAPYQYVDGRRSPFPGPIGAMASSRPVAVLGARRGDDGVVVSRQPDGRWVVDVVAPGSRTPVAVVDGPDDAVWTENPQRTGGALLLRGQARLLRLVRADGHWLPAGDTPLREAASAACPASSTGSALVVGPGAQLVTGSSAAVATDLRSVGECGWGAHGGFVVGRQIDDQGRRSTAIRGVTPAGEVSWRRDDDHEDLLSLDPSGSLLAVVADGGLDILDDHGGLVHHESDVASAQFTGDAELVTVSPSGAVVWHSRGELGGP